MKVIEWYELYNYTHHKNNIVWRMEFNETHVQGWVDIYEHNEHRRDEHH